MKNVKEYRNKAFCDNKKILINLKINKFINRISFISDISDYLITCLIRVKLDQALPCPCHLYS